MKKKILLLLSYFVLAIKLAKTQDVPIKNEWVIKFGMQLNVIQKGTQSPYSQFARSSISLAPRIGASGGGEWQFRKNKKLGFGIGLTANYTPFHQKITGLRWKGDFDSITRQVHPSETNVNAYFLELGIPLKTYFRINKKAAWSIGITPLLRVVRNGIMNVNYPDNYQPDINNPVTIQAKRYTLQGAMSYQYIIKKTKNKTWIIEPFASVNLRGDNLFLYYTNNRFYSIGVSASLKR